jgi:hypothetical protein
VPKVRVVESEKNGLVASVVTAGSFVTAGLCSLDLAIESAAVMIKT